MITSNISKTDKQKSLTYDPSTIRNQDVLRRIVEN